MASDASIQTILKRTFKEFGDDDCTAMAAALAYYTVFSLPPLLVIVVIVAGLVFQDPQRIQEVIQGWAGSLGQGAGDQIEAMIRNAQERVTGGFSFGLILSIAGLLFSATGAFAQLQKTLNRAWEVAPDPDAGGIKNFITKRVLSLGMILTVAFLLAVSLLLSTAISTVGQGLSAILPGGMGQAVSYAIDLGLSLVIFTLLFGAIFKVLPDAHVAWADVWKGALVTAVLFVIGKFAIGFYLGQSSPGDAYGQAGALALILVWVYYSSIIIFLGAEFTQVWAQTRGQGIRPDDDAVRVIEEVQHDRSHRSSAD